MNTICTFLWGHWEMPDGGVSYVHALLAGVRKHLGIPVRFVLFTDHNEEEFDRDIEVQDLGEAGFWPGNLKKMAMFDPHAGLSGNVMALDLDTVVVGDFQNLLTDFVQQHFITCECAYHLQQPGGGVHRFSAGWGVEELWEPLSTQPEVWFPLAKGSERLYLKLRLKEQLKTPIDYWQEKYPGQVVSFKLCCGEGLPRNAKLVWFHGIPRPHHCLSIPWVQEAVGSFIRGSNPGPRESPRLGETTLPGLSYNA